MKKYFLTIDNGGTNTKAIIFDTEGHQIDVSSFPTMRIEEKSGYHEIDLTKLWQAISNAIRQVITNSHIQSSEIIGISCVGHGKGLYFLDKANRIFTNGILSTDSRATQLAKKFEEKIDTIFPITHQHVMNSQAPVLLKWLKQNNQQLYANIGTILSAKDFVRSQLTGKIYQEYGDASGNNLLNLSTQDYDSRILAFFDIEEMRDKLPPLKRFDELAGYVTAGAAEKTGLCEGTPVYGGMFDIDACSLATGVLNQDYISTIAGTWNINTLLSKSYANQEDGLMNSIYPTGDNLIESSSPTSAGNLSIMLNNLMRHEIDNATHSGNNIYAILEEFLSHTNSHFSKVIFLPFLYGSNVNPDAQGAYIGIRSDTTKSEMIRAVYEGIVFAHKQHIEQLVRFLGHKPKAVRLSGGATNSDSWMQMFANVLDIPVQTVQCTELGGLGGAMGAAVGSGTYDSLDDAVERMAHLKKEFIPQNSEVRIFSEKYTIYADLLHHLDDSWGNLKYMQERITE